MARIGIVGALGYTGHELLRLLIEHPQVEVAVLADLPRFAGTVISDVFPSLEGRCDLALREFVAEEMAGQIDLALLGLPHKEGMTVAPSLLKCGIKVVDLSADYRFRDRAIYEAWYKETHTSPDLLEKAVYGLPEIYREDIRGASLVANPGCYPVSAILPLYPILKERLIEADSIVLDSKSGVSGAGRRGDLALMFAEVNESLKAYGIGTHRHSPEIEQELSRAAGKPVQITFVPHLMPITRGILTTVYAKVTQGVSTTGCLEALNAYYGQEPFVMVCKEGVYPEVRNVRHSNGCHIGLRVDERNGRVVMVSVIDNLGKGASWNAVQNMNLMCGFPETLGIGGAGAFI